ncbi:translation initiation factor IF3 [Purpureocillium lavendulum]|uniref:Translation initiation factor IF3 n=1 Tax=Purpureocillium lavendulum TaxID=1247861 RepID=A0AB34FGY7_9HYPO|nr:translation initiation factor IF3 [Purpureocillium lavendulum]
MPDVDATAMEPFVKLDRYPLVVCKKCRFACVANETVAHLREKHTSMDAKERRRVIEKAMWDSFNRVIERARSIATSIRVGSPALFEVQRKEIEKKPSRPFDNRMEEDSWARYKDAWRRLLCILYRTQTGDSDDIPPYELTKRQRKAYYAFADAIEA